MTQEEIERALAEAFRLGGEGRLDEARKRAEQASAAAAEMLGQDHPTYGRTLAVRASFHRRAEEYDDAVGLYGRALEIFEASGPETPLLAVNALVSLAKVHELRGDPAAAAPLLDEATKRLRALSPGPDRVLHETLVEVGATRLALGELADAADALVEAREIGRALFGYPEPSVSAQFRRSRAPDEAGGETPEGEPVELFDALLDVADYQAGLGERQDGERLLLRLFETRTRLHGDGPEAAQALEALGEFNRFNEFQEPAHACLVRAFALRESSPGPRRLDLAWTANRLALVLDQLGRYAAARELYQLGYDIRAAVLDEGDPDVIESLFNLAELARATGDHETARRVLGRIVESMPESERRGVVFAKALNNLGEVELELGLIADAEPHIEAGYRLRQELFPPNDPVLVRSADARAFLEIAKGRFAAARDEFERGAEALRSGRRRDSYGIALANLAFAHSLLGERETAEPLYDEAIALIRSARGEQDAMLAGPHVNLAFDLWDRDRHDEALVHFREAARADDRGLLEILRFATSAHVAQLLPRARLLVSAVVTLVTRHLAESPEAARTALEVVLRRKGIAGEVAALRRAVIRRERMDALDALARLDAIRLQIGLDEVDSRDARKAGRVAPERLAEERERLETGLAGLVPKATLEALAEIGVDEVVAALPDEAALVEFVRYGGYGAAASAVAQTTNRYAAFVVRKAEPESIALVDLGAAGSIDEAIEALRRSIVAEAESRDIVDVTPRAPVDSGPATEDVRRLVWDPLRPALGDSTRVFLAPDGELFRLPFDVLLDEQGRCLLDTHRLSYLPVARDLLALGYRRARSRRPPVVVASPDYDLSLASTGEAGAAPPEPSDAVEAMRGAGRQFRPLRATRAEGMRVAEALGVEPWLDADAVEGLLKRVHDPEIVHIATHGFYVEDAGEGDPIQAVGTASRTGLASMLASASDPLVRSGLALAGANTVLRGDAVPEPVEDGLLMAADAVMLDLYRTDLVVLSACDTGLGAIEVGEGVNGLVRSFSLAGARTVVMSLWKVPDERTRELMEAFYERLLAGEPRIDALRGAQGALREHYPESPWSWGAFVLQGDPGPLLRFRDDLPVRRLEGAVFAPPGNGVSTYDLETGELVEHVSLEGFRPGRGS